MADTRISDMPAAATLTGAEVVPVLQSAANAITTAAGLIAQPTHAATSKATPVNADEFPLADSAASFGLKKLTWANLKATLKTYTDTLYALVGAATTSGLTMSTARLLGRTTAASGAIEEISAGSGLTLSAGSLTAASMANATIKGRTTAGTGTPEDLTAAQAAAIVQGDGTTTAALCGFREIPGNSQSANYTAVAADNGKSIDHPSTDANARTFTIPANSSVAYPVGTTLSFSNMTSQVVTIAITTDALYLANAGTTGSRSLAQYGIATARKLTSTTWIISGSGLT